MQSYCGSRSLWKHLSEGLFRRQIVPQPRTSPEKTQLSSKTAEVQKPNSGQEHGQAWKSPESPLLFELELLNRAPYTCRHA